MRISDWSSDVCSSDLIARLAIALVQPREDAHDLGVALRPQQRIIGLELRTRACCRGIAIEHGALKFGRNIAPRILEQRDKIISGMADQRVLKIDTIGRA